MFTVQKALPLMQDGGLSSLVDGGFATHMRS